MPAGSSRTAALLPISPPCSPREAPLAPDAWEKGIPGDLALLASAESHYSVARAAGILGLGHDAVYALEVDSKARIVADRIPAMVARVRSDGRRPMALVANACSTALGLYDPLAEISAACRQHGIWLHVDGAHGASALLSETHRSLLRGVENADSLGVGRAQAPAHADTLCRGPGPRRAEAGRRVPAGGELPLP